MSGQPTPAPASSTSSHPGYQGGDSRVASTTWTGPEDPGTDALLHPAARVVPVVGAGISAGAGAPTTTVFCQHLLTQFQPDRTDGFSLKDPRSIANNIIDQRKASRDDVRRSVGSLYDPKNWTFDPSDAVRAIAQAASGWAITLSYDPSIELAAASLGIRPRSFTWKDLPAWDEAVDDRDCLKVFHPHGCWDDSDSIILDAAGYAELRGNQTYRIFLSLVLSSHHPLFVGTVLDEPYLVDFLQDLPKNQPSGVIFVNREPDPAYQERLKLERPLVIVEQYDAPGHDFSAVDAICHRYLVDPQPPSPVPAVVLPELDSLYVPQLLVPYSSDEKSSTARRWELALMPERATPEADLAKKQRTLVVGSPGSGKSELLRQASRQLPTGYQAVYVRLPRTSGDGENAAQTLAGWVDSVRDEHAEPTTDETLAQQRFHFLLDGLDEVPAGEQDAVAQHIVDVAAEFPQHRYTVTSRPVPAVDAFAVEEWEQLQLLNNWEWRKAYFAKAQVDVAALEARVPALGDLSELLQLPFFIRTLVQLDRKNALPEHVDMLTLSQAFIDRALADEDAAFLRGWLRDIAFAMQVAGRTELKREELEAFALPNGLKLDPRDDIVDLLARHSVLEQDAEGQVHFVHRLLAETLVAEKLLALGPEQDHLLDVVAPRTDHATGARGEWMVPLVLAGAHSPAWRAAIRTRDPLAAARMVPAGAGEDERREAALTLWRTFVDARLWMHDMESPRLLQDSETMGRMLRRGDVPDVVDEVLGAIYNPSRQVRSNAIEVLESARLRDELEPIVRATLSGDSDLVVRRHAASAARELNLTAAYPLVKKRAFDTVDKTENQVLVGVALHLAPPDELVQLSLHLIDAGFGDYWDTERLVRERVGPDAALQLMEERAKRGELSKQAKREFVKLAQQLPDDERTTARLAYLAAAGLDDQALDGRFQTHPVAALTGVVEAVQSGAARWFEPLRIVLLVPAETLEQVEFQDEGLRERYQSRIARETVPSNPVALAAADNEADEEGQEPPPTLSELLDRGDDAEWLLKRNARFFGPDVQALGRRHRRQLEEWVWKWWPDVGITASITGTNITWEAYACLIYGARLRLKLTSEQWADVAHASMPTEEKDEWLQARYTRAGANVAATTWADSGAEAWAHLADAIPRKLPLAVVSAMAARIKDADPYLDNLCARLLNEGRLPALKKLARVPGPVGEAAVYYVARAGDYRAQRRCLDWLLTKAGTATNIHSDDLGWMEAVTDKRLLPDLFVALVDAYNHRNPDRFMDAMGPIQEAIRRIGGRDALVGYDALLARDPEPFEGAQFLRLQRDAIENDMLRAAGDDVAPTLLSALGLPKLGQPGDDAPVTARKRKVHSVAS